MSSRGPMHDASTLMHTGNALTIGLAPRPNGFHVYPVQVRRFSLTSWSNATRISARGPYPGGRSLESTLPRSHSTSTCSRCPTIVLTSGDSSTRGKHHRGEHFASSRTMGLYKLYLCICRYHAYIYGVESKAKLMPQQQILPCNLVYIQAILS